MKSARNLCIASLIGVVWVVQTVAQICPYNHTKCVCHDTFVTCSGLQEIPPLVPGIHVTYFTTVNFEGGNIISVPSSNLPPGLEKLTFSGHPLTNWSDDAFDKSEGTLYLLNITGAKFKQLPQAFLKLTSLDRLIIVNTAIQHWNGSVLQHIATIVPDLELINVGLSAWPTWISYFHLLHTLYLSGNSLIAIPDDAFSSFRNTLSRVILDNTGLTHVPQALEALPNLNNLDLSGNKLADVAEIEKLALMPSGTKLTDLSISSIGLTKMLNFSKMKNLFSVNLNYNEISDAASGSFPQFVTSLYIQGNELPVVPKDVATMSGLYTLLLSNNQITRIEPAIFPPSLGYLDLGFNKLTVITNTDFINLTAMETLYLNNNPITTISLLAFTNLASLITLDISNTYLVQVPVALTSLSSVIELNMAIPSLSCPCPTSSQLVKWFTHAGRNISLSGQCCTGQSIDSYLSAECTSQQTTCLAPTTVEQSTFCIFSCLLLLPALRFCRH